MTRGLRVLGASIGSKYTATETAGDGSMITAGSRVRYVPGRHSIFDYDQPQPQSGSVGTVFGDFHEFNKQMWATVVVEGQPNRLNPMDGAWTIRTKDLRSLEAREKAVPAALHSFEQGPTRARHHTTAARSFFFVAAAIVLLALIGGRS